MLAVISAGLLVVAAVVLFRGRAPSDSGQSVRDWWTRKGVEKPNVVLISLDTTRADHLGCYGNADARTPAIDGLASAAAYRPARCPASHTAARTAPWAKMERSVAR